MPVMRCVLHRAEPRPVLCCVVYRVAPCPQDFFSYDSSSGLVSPCSEQTSGMLVCSQLTDLVSSAAEFCKAAGEEPCADGVLMLWPLACLGLKPSAAAGLACTQAAAVCITRAEISDRHAQAAWATLLPLRLLLPPLCTTTGFGRMAAGVDEPCFDGTPVSADACPAEPSPAQKQRKKQRRRATTTSSSRQEPSDLMGRLIAWLPWRLKRRQKRQLEVAVELLFGLCVSGFMAWLVVAMLQRVMQVGAGKPCGAAAVVGWGARHWPTEMTPCCRRHAAAVTETQTHWPTSSQCAGCAGEGS